MHLTMLAHHLQQQPPPLLTQTRLTRLSPITSRSTIKFNRGQRHLGDLRVAMDSVGGCFFYGAFAAKVLIVRSRRLPGWALPVAGGLLVTLIVVMWYSSALWYFDGSRLPLP